MRHHTERRSAQHTPTAAPVARLPAPPVERRAPVRGGMLRSLRHRDFLLFWIGLGLALTGFQVQRVALGFLAYDLTGSAFYLTLIFFGDSIPMLVLAPIGGVVVDRVDRKAMLVVTRSLIAALAIVVGILAVTGLIAAWHLLAFTLLTGVLYSFDIPTRQAAIRDLVPEEDFFNAVALASSVIQASRIVGPAIGGLLLVWVGAGGALAGMAAGSLGMVLMVALTHLPRSTAAPARGALADLREGARFMLRTEPIASLMLVSALGAMFATTYQSLTPVFARDVLGQGKGAIGVMLAAAGVGALAGSAAVAAYGERFGKPSASAWAAVVFGLLVSAYALSRSYPLSLVLLVLVGAVGAVYSVVNSTVVQARTPRELQGRVMGAYQLTWNVTLFGSLAIGALADRLGAQVAGATAGLATVAAVGALIAVRPVLRARET